MLCVVDTGKPYFVATVNHNAAANIAAINPYFNSVE